VLLSTLPIVTPEFIDIPIPLSFLDPFLVVIITTPLAALDPYNALAAAPFKTLIDSMSSGFISEAALP